MHSLPLARNLPNFQLPSERNFDMSIHPNICIWINQYLSWVTRQTTLLFLGKCTTFLLLHTSEHLSLSVPTGKISQNHLFSPHFYLNLHFLVVLLYLACPPCLSIRLNVCIWLCQGLSIVEVLHVFHLISMSFQPCLSFSQSLSFQPLLSMFWQCSAPYFVVICLFLSLLLPVLVKHSLGFSVDLSNLLLHLILSRLSCWYSC
jgi:hypothetical protein